MHCYLFLQIIVAYIYTNFLILLFFLITTCTFLCLLLFFFVTVFTFPYILLFLFLYPIQPNWSIEYKPNLLWSNSKWWATGHMILRQMISWVSSTRTVSWPISVKSKVIDDWFIDQLMLVARIVSVRLKAMDKTIFQHDTVL